MPAFDPDVSRNLLALQRQIDRIGTAPMGPVSVGAGEGSIRFHGADGDVFFADAAGAQVRHRGALVALTDLTEGHTASLEAHQVTLDAHSTRLTGYGESITSLGGRVTSAENSISAHGTRLTSYGNSITSLGGRASSLESRASTLESQMSGKASVSYADAIDSRARAAQSRADSAYSLAASRASSGDVSAAVATAKQYTDSRITALITALRNQGIVIAM